MNDELKKMLMQKAENHAVQALDDAIEIAEMYAASTEETQVDDGVVSAVKLLKGLIVDALDKIDGEDNK